MAEKLKLRALTSHSIVGRLRVSLWKFAAAALLLLPLSQSGLSIDWAKRDEEFVKEILPILNKACLDCHSGAEADGGLALSHFKSAKAVLKERKTWEKVMTRVQLGDMPPKEAPPMPDADRKKLNEWINTAINDVECGKTPNPGSITVRRLNKFEYRNTIRDLFGLDYEPSSDFPGDDVGYGFDNIGDVLTLPPLLMEKYLTAAEQISRSVIIAPTPGPIFENSYKPEQLKPDRGGRSSGTEILIYSNGGIEWEEQAPWTGTFYLEMLMGSTKVNNVGAKVLVTVDEKKIREFEVKATPDKRDDYQIPLRLKAGKRKIRVEFTNDASTKSTDGKTGEDRNLSIYTVKVSGQKKGEPIPAAELPSSHTKIINVQPSASLSNADALKKVLTPLASRVYRRPALSEETIRLVKLSEAVMDEGDSFEAAVQVGLQAMLVSPHFLFKIERPEARSEDGYPLVSEFELATRLSYFLWSTSPDDELLKLAWKNQLRQPGVLQAQVKRMIADKRANAFVENFAGQWLTLRKLDSVSPNENMFPLWNDQIRDLARRETYTFFAGVMREDQSVLRLLDADFTYLNEPLAKFYGIPGVEGTHFRKVSLANQPRRGILTHASILAVTSNPTRTSPVKRGKWILDNLLNTPPPAAPPGVPELEKSELTGTLRQRIEQHRADPACASCHKLMDPLGLALENFDAVGRWRTKDAGAPIDASGELPNGEKVQHAGDLIRNLRERNADKFIRCLTEKMMTFALGRGLEYYDKCAVDQITAKLKANDNRLSVMVTEIILSAPFQRKGVKDDL